MIFKNLALISVWLMGCAAATGVAGMIFAGFGRGLGDAETRAPSVIPMLVISVLAGIAVAFFSGRFAVRRCPDHAALLVGVFSFLFGGLVSMILFLAVCNPVSLLQFGFGILVYLLAASLTGSALWITYTYIPPGARLL